MAYRNRAQNIIEDESPESPDVISAESPDVISAESPDRTLAASPIYQSPLRDEHWQREDYWQEHKSLVKEKMQGYKSETSFSDELFESLHIGKERMVGEDRKMVIQLQSLLKHVDEENQESFLNDLIDAYSDPNSSFQVVLLNPTIESCYSDHYIHQSIR